MAGHDLHLAIVEFFGSWLVRVDDSNRADDLQIVCRALGFDVFAHGLLPSRIPARPGCQGAASSLAYRESANRGSYDPTMNKAELHAQIDQMTDEEAADAKLVFAPDWPSEATSIEEIRKRTGTSPISAEEFDRHFGSLPTDGEG